MKDMKVVIRANELLDAGLTPDDAEVKLLSEAPDAEKIEWFDKAAGRYLVFQLDAERKRAAKRAAKTSGD